MRSAILLVDDDDFARSFARTVLERAGYHVHEANDIASGLAIAGSLTPVAVVTDWNLPDGNGGDLARILHEDSEALPVVLITGETDAAIMLPREALDEFTSIISKPFSPSVLERTVHAAVQQIPHLAVGS